jgi:hypothetical protein
MITRSRAFGNHEVVISVSLYGDHELYLNGALNMVSRINTIKRNYFYLTLHLHHDDSVPAFFLKQMDGKKNVLLINQTQLGWKNHERMFWRFLSTSTSSICFIVDLDEDPLVFLMETEHFWFRHSVKLKLCQKSAILTHLPYWKVNNHRILIPGSLSIFINFGLEEFGLYLQDKIASFIKNTTFKYDSPSIMKGETNARLGNTYGLDEFFLTNVLVPNLQITEIFFTTICKITRYKSNELRWEYVLYPQQHTLQKI